ncbi:MAG: hypothetical protein HY777_12865 [Betaproteobacteria bacterium]|nr:hypothetical protein [Betaproteobacteria bacterium]
MTPFRHLLFAVLLLLAQSGALTHAVEHLRPDAHAPANHTCALCIAAQGVDAALVSAPPAIAPRVVKGASHAFVIVPVFPASAVSPRARAPPAA